MVQYRAQTKNMRLLAQHDLGGYGNGGEGLALQATADARRMLYIAHESAPKDFSVVDVSDPYRPRLIAQTELPHTEVRSNSLDLSGDILLVAYQSATPGVTPAGVGVYDVSNPAAPSQLAFFDTSGPHSRGCHCLWFVDGRYAHLSTGASDFQPTNPRDDQFYMIVDMADPTKPEEVGRWWLPGTRVGDEAPPPVRHDRLDAGFRPHNTNVYPQRPDRAYVGYLDAGAIILDISELTRPELIARLDYHPPMPGFTHTVLPLFERGLLVVTDEATREDCSDWPKLSWVVDGSHETNPVILSTLPMPSPEEFCARPGRFGAHNVHENQPVPTAWRSDRYIVGSYFNAGVRVHDIGDPFRAQEIAYYVPQVPAGVRAVALNDVYVDERGIVYTVDRLETGLHILEMEV